MTGLIIFLFIAPVVIGMWMVIWVLYRFIHKAIKDGDL